MGEIKKFKPDYNFSTIMNEVDLWDQFVKIIIEREQIDHLPDSGEELLTQAKIFAKDGLNKEDKTFTIDDPPSREQKRLISCNIISCSGLICHFNHEKLQDFLYAWDATQRHRMPTDVLSEILPYRTRNIIVWMEKLYQRQDQALHKQFLKESFNA